MDTTNIINLFVAIGTIGAVIVALVGIWLNGKQAKNDWDHSQQLAREERQHQSRPIIVPRKEIFHNTITYISLETGESSENIYTSEHTINWSWNHEIRIKLHNMGSGPAFNLHCVLYGPQATCQSQFVSWDNGPIEEKSSMDIDLMHSSELRLFHNDSIDGKHPLYDMSLDSPSNPMAYPIACLTITYHDLFGNKHVSIFHFTLQHQWIHVPTEKIPGKPPLDLKELNAQKRQQGIKLSAPAPITSQGN
jgi:hypothetical protein